MRAAWIMLVGCVVLTTTAHVSFGDGGADFERDVAPILVRHCAGCHNASDPAGGLDLTSQARARTGGESKQPAFVAGDVAASHAIERIAAGEMPPEGKGKPLADVELATLKAWIAAGAPWPADRVLSPAEFTTETRAGRDWWSFTAPRRPPLPVVRQAERVRTPIDAFVLARLGAEGLPANEETDRATFIRRASLDLHGLPPTHDEIKAFVDDPAADAYEKLIDRLLTSPRYGERWARHWLDVARFGESNGYETNTARPTAWPYRDWVIAALNADIPYPRFIFEQVAGDQTGADAATGFLVGGAHDAVGSPDVELTLQQRLNDLDDMVSTTAGAFLGLTVGCAKCHDHKFDPISQRDYYSMQSLVAGVQHGTRELRTSDSERRQQRESAVRAELLAVESKVQSLVRGHQPLARVGASTSDEKRPAVSPRANVERFAPARARFVRFTVLATSQVEPCLDELEIFTADTSARNVALASAGAKATTSSVYSNGTSKLHQLEHINDGRYGNGHSWISGEGGAGWVQIELAEPAVIDAVVWGRDREGVFGDRLATRYRVETSENGATWQTVADHEDRQPFDPAAAASASSTVKAEEGLPPEIAAQVARLNGEAATLKAQLASLAPQSVYAGTFAKPEPTYLLYRGEPMQKRDRLAPGGIAAVAPRLALDADAAETARRVALAQWLGSEANPLSARVMVNRIWHYHFGQGLVRTPSDFGFNGGHASHPELLDWLATEFMAGGWRAKSIHRTIMLSSTYRQSSRTSAACFARDAGNRLLWRFAPRRLEAEPIRDAILWASGVLDQRMGGPGYVVFEPNTNYVKVYKPKQDFGPAEWRRMVYQDKPRMRQDATFGEFDCPDSSQQMARRNVSTTALQALNLLNGPFLIQQAGLLAARLEREAPGDLDAQIQNAFWLIFGRPADAEELAAARMFVAEQGLSAFCRAIFNANEFVWVN